MWFFLFVCFLALKYYPLCNEHLIIDYIHGAISIYQKLVEVSKITHWIFIMIPCGRYYYVPVFPEKELRHKDVDELVKVT